MTRGRLSPALAATSRVRAVGFLRGMVEAWSSRTPRDDTTPHENTLGSGRRGRVGGEGRGVEARARAGPPRKERGPRKTEGDGGGEGEGEEGESEEGREKKYEKRQARAAA